MTESEIPKNIYLVEYYENNETKSIFVAAGCVEEVIQKFRDEGFENEIFHIHKNRVQALIL